MAKKKYEYRILNNNRFAVYEVETDIIYGKEY